MSNTGIKILNNKIIVDLPKEVIEYFTRCGVICTEPDGSKYYNIAQWLRVDISGVVTAEYFKDLPDHVKAVHLQYINQPAATTAKQEAIGFAEFIKDNSYTKGGKGWYKYYEKREDFPSGYSMMTPVYEFLTIEELYQLYLNSKK